MTLHLARVFECARCFTCTELWYFQSIVVISITTHPMGCDAELAFGGKCPWVCWGDLLGRIFHGVMSAGNSLRGWDMSGRNCTRRECLGRCVWGNFTRAGGFFMGGNIQGMFGQLSRLGVHIPLQDHKSSHAAVVICATLVNTQTHRPTNSFQPDVYHELSEFN